MAVVPIFYENPYINKFKDFKFKLKRIFINESNYLRKYLW